jgi:CRP/FNR family transcriptional regulator, cyclic AMP receptor protein
MKFFGNNNNSEKLERLTEIPAFRELAHNEILEVEAILHERTYEKGEVVFEEGDPGHGIFIVLSGKLRVTPSCELLKISSLDFGPGDMVGELSLFEEAPRPATLVAVERTETVALFQAEFFSLLTKNKSIGAKVLIEIARTLSRRARQLLLGEKRAPSL